MNHDILPVYFLLVKRPSTVTCGLAVHTMGDVIVFLVVITMVMGDRLFISRSLSVVSKDRGH